MAKSENSMERKFQICGWILFIISAVFYGIASIRTGDMISLLASFFFLIACFVFLIPFIFPR